MLDESIKRSASDRLGDLVPQVRARTSPGVFRDMALLGLCLELSFSVLYCRTQANLPTFNRHRRKSRLRTREHSRQNQLSRTTAFIQLKYLYDSKRLKSESGRYSDFADSSFRVRESVGYSGSHHSFTVTDYSLSSNITAATSRIEGHMYDAKPQR